MNRGITLAWAAAIGIIAYRSVKIDHRPPMPGQLATASGAFVLLALLAEPAPELATTLAWGLVAGAWLNIGTIGGSISARAGRDVRTAPTGPNPQSSSGGSAGPRAE